MPNLANQFWNFVAGITKEGRFEALNDEVIIETNAYFVESDISCYMRLKS